MHDTPTAYIIIEIISKVSEYMYTPRPTIVLTAKLSYNINN